MLDELNSLLATKMILRLYSPDRWNNLSAAARSAPGLFANVMTFSAGPRVCRPASQG